MPHWITYPESHWKNIIGNLHSGVIVNKLFQTETLQRAYIMNPLSQPSNRKLLGSVTILGFHVASRDHKIPLNSRYRFFCLQKWIEPGHVSEVANFWFSSHNFDEVAVIQKSQYFQS